MKHYDIKKNWSKVKPFLQDKEFNKILKKHLNKYSKGSRRKPYKEGMIPADLDNSDWRYYGKSGRKPEFWDYVTPGACHWLVSAYLRLAMLVEPKKEWRIVGDEHSTVWDGADTIFDLGYFAFDISAEDTFNKAMVGDPTLVLKPGIYHDPGYPAYYGSKTKTIKVDGYPAHFSFEVDIDLPEFDEERGCSLRTHIVHQEMYAQNIDSPCHMYEDFVVESVEIVSGGEVWGLGS